MTTVITQDSWVKLKLDLTQRSRAMTDAMLKYIDTQSDDLLRRLRHDVDVYPDPKTYYQKELPYKLEDVVNGDLRKLAELMSKGFNANLTWLQSVLKSFGVKSFNVPFMTHQLDSEEYVQEDLELIDIHATKLKARAGTLVTCLALSPYGIAVFAGSMIAGTIAEELMLSRAQQSRELIQECLPDIIARYKSQMKAHVLTAMAVPQKQIMNAITSKQNEYFRQ